MRPSVNGANDHARPHVLLDIIGRARRKRRGEASVRVIGAERERAV